MTDPYRAPGRDVTEADCAEPVTPPMPPARPMIEAMIEAYTEARRRSHGRAFDLVYILSHSALLAFELEVSFTAFYEEAVARIRSNGEGNAPRRRGCQYRGTFRGCPMFVDPEMLGGWTAEMGYTR